MDALALIAEGSRVSSVARVKGHKEDTITEWLRDAAQHAEAIGAELLKELPRWIVSSIMALMWLGIIVWSVWLTRARIRRRLREMLILEGFPICGPCGYDLRGSTEPRCPECGAPFDKKLLTESPPQTEDSGQQDDSES